MFLGEYEHSLDAKQRLAIPSEIRDAWDEDSHGKLFIAAPGQNGCLWLWPEKKFEKPLEQRDTIYLISSEWLIPWDDVNFLMYSGGADFPYMWNTDYGYGFPNGTIPWSNLVYNPVVDSTVLEMKIEFNQDSLLVAKIDSSLQQFKQKEKTKKYLTIRELIAQKFDERVEKFRKVKRVLRAARSRKNENDKDRLVVDWKGRRFGF